MATKSLEIQGLSDRHEGVTSALSSSYYEAACVCLDRHHAPPREVTLIDNGIADIAVVAWEASDQRTRNAWANSVDATEAGAYCLALAHVEITRGLVAVSRAQGRTGVDYYLGSADSAPEDFEASVRLEVSGTDEGNLTTIKSRLRQKLVQAGRIDSNLPAIATVVAFALLRIESADVQQ
ncbi:MAG TPA: hypothetical protein VH913_24395 [Hyphomicrobiaceae bacterium]|jgi:hypothetical protein